MYSATWDNINRHILVVWQSVAALFTALGAFYLFASSPPLRDFASSLIILTAGWSVAIAIDASGWYNRNLLIIANIEQQFLRPKDRKEIHPYFEHHRSSGPIDFLMIQIVLGCTIAFLALAQHFTTRVMPAFGQPLSALDPWVTLPYALFFSMGLGLTWLSRKVTRKYAELLAQSPGRGVDVPDSRAV